MLLAVAGPAAGAPPWSPPTTPSERVSASPVLEFAADGRALLSYGDDAGIKLATGDASGRFTETASLPAESFIVPRPFGRDRVLILRFREDGLQVRLGVSFGDSSGARRQASADRALPPTRHRRGFPSFSVGAGGHAAVAWLERTSRPRRPHLRLAQRRPGEPFRRPPRYRPAHPRQPRRRAAGGRRRPPRAHGHRVGGRAAQGDRQGARRPRGREARADPGARPLPAVAEGDLREATIVAGVARGRIVVAWGPPRHFGESGGRGWPVGVATAPSRTGRFRPAQRLGSPGPSRGCRRGLALALAPGGDALVAWSEYAPFPGPPPSGAALALPGRRFGAPIALGEGLVSDVAMRRDGAALVMWTGRHPASTTPDAHPVLATVRRPGAAGFEAPELVSDPEDRPDQWWRRSTRPPVAPWPYGARPSRSPTRGRPRCTPPPARRRSRSALHVDADVPVVGAADLDLLVAGAAGARDHHLEQAVLDGRGDVAALDRPGRA